MTTPLVTVLIDTYNHERFIEEAIVSVLEQDFPRSEMEILVVDDGSTDSTPEVLRKFEPYLRVLRKENGGQASAFNVGIPEARGEVIAFLDGDDWWAKNKLSLVMDALEGNAHAGTIGHGIVEVDTDASTSRELAPDPTARFDLSSDEGAQTFRNYMAFLGTSRVTIRKSVLTRVVAIPEALIVEADEFMSAIAVAHSGAALLSEPLAFYRLHGANLFQFRAGDSVRARRKQRVLESLASELELALSGLGVAPSAISIIVEPIRISALRMRLALDGGMPWETYRVEKADFRQAYGRATPAYRIYKQMSLLLSLVLPPRAYYEVRRLYAANDLRRFRSWVGEPEPKAHIRETRLRPEQSVPGK